jgi:hypothetical protein
MYQPVNKPYGLNHSLGYLPWTQLLDGLAEWDRGFIRDQCIGQNESPANTIRLIPGMKLVVDDSSVLTLGANRNIPGIARYEWIVPADSFGPADYFFLSYLLMSCQLDPSPDGKPQDLVAKMWATAAQLATNSGNLAQQLSDLLVKTFLPSLQMVHVRAGEWSGAPGTASRVREWLTQPSAADLGPTVYKSPFNPTQTLQAQIPIDTGGGVQNVGISAFRSGSAFFLDSVPAPPGPQPPPNAWYTNIKNINFRRQRLEVHIPVRASQSIPGASSGWHYVPVHWSIADFEKDIGIKTSGIRRRPDLISCVKDQGKLDIDRTRLVSTLDGRAGISFVSADPLGALDIVYIQQQDAALKNDLLLAPGDVVIVHA